MKLCEFENETKFELVYRASRDGFSASSFHSKCNSIPKSLTIIKTTNNYVFGGYTEAAWYSNGQYTSNDNTFIFSLINKNNAPIKIKCTYPPYAIYNNPSYGPSFGGGHDLYISDSSNINTSSYSNLGSSYCHPLYASGSIDAQSFLAGSYNFQTVEIEVFKKI